MSEIEARKKHWARVQNAFLDLVDLEPRERAESLERLRDESQDLAEEVVRLLEHDDGDALESSPPIGRDAQPSEPASPYPTFGPYVAIGRIGSGGMGDVFLAKRSDGAFEREVAIKVIRTELSSPTVVERFLRERKVLAALEHPSIVRLLDGGTTNGGTTHGGSPYFVMEHVEGKPLGEFASSQALSIAGRMKLMVKVAEAVGYAHSEGVVHRDLKPSNVLVRADGEPRLLDFGIARTLSAVDGDVDEDSALTRTGHRLFTPRYASPEQVRGEPVTASSDVFALGILIYELLAGRSPWSTDVSDFDLEKEIEAAEPVRPSRRASGTSRLAIAGDFDTIALKCLSQRPADRYSDGGALAEDLTRALSGRTILARRTTTVERGWRLVKRRPWQAAALVATVLAAVGMLASLRKDRASAARDAEIGASLPVRLGSIKDMIKDRKLELAAETLAALQTDVAGFRLTPVDEAEFLLTRGLLRKREGDWASTLEHVERALALEFPRADERSTRVGLELEWEKANALAALRRLPESEIQIREATELCISALGASHERSARFLALLGRVLAAQGKSEEAVDAFERAASTYDDDETKHNLPLAEIQMGLGRALGDQLRDEEAIVVLEHALEVFQWHHGTRDLKATEVLVFLSRSYEAVGRNEEALEAATTACQAYRELKSPIREFLARRMADEFAVRLDDPATSLIHADRALELLEGAASRFSSFRPDVMARRGRALLDLDRNDEARLALGSAVDSWPADQVDGMSIDFVWVRAWYGEALERTGDAEGARRERELALELLRENTPESGSQEATLLDELTAALTR